MGASLDSPLLVLESSIMIWEGGGFLLFSFWGTDSDQGKRLYCEISRARERAGLLLVSEAGNKRQRVAVS